jgi:hypothetical protein
MAATLTRSDAQHTTNSTVTPNEVRTRNPWRFLGELPEPLRLPMLAYLRTAMAHDDTATEVIHTLARRLRSELATRTIQADYVTQVQYLCVALGRHRQAAAELATAACGRSVARR